MSHSSDRGFLQADALVCHQRRYSLASTRGVRLDMFQLHRRTPDDVQPAPLPLPASRSPHPTSDSSPTTRPHDRRRLNSFTFNDRCFPTTVTDTASCASGCARSASFSPITTTSGDMLSLLTTCGTPPDWTGSFKTENYKGNSCAAPTLFGTATVTHMWDMPSEANCVCLYGDSTEGLETSTYFIKQCTVCGGATSSVWSSDCDRNCANCQRPSYSTTQPTLFPSSPGSCEPITWTSATVPDASSCAFGCSYSRLIGQPGQPQVTTTSGSFIYPTCNPPPAQPPPPPPTPPPPPPPAPPAPPPPESLMCATSRAYALAGNPLASRDAMCLLWVDAGYTCSSTWADGCSQDHPLGAEYNSFLVLNEGCSQCEESTLPLGAIIGGAAGGAAVLVLLLAVGLCVCMSRKKAPTAPAK